MNNPDSGRNAKFPQSLPIFFCLLLMLFAQAPSSSLDGDEQSQRRAFILPKDTELKVELVEDLDLDHCSANNNFDARVVETVKVGDAICLPAGTEIGGRTLFLKSRVILNSSYPELSFEWFRLKPGTQVPMNALVVCDRKLQMTVTRANQLVSYPLELQLPVVVGAPLPKGSKLRFQPTEPNFLALLCKPSNNHLPKLKAGDIFAIRLREDLHTDQ